MSKLPRLFPAIIVILALAYLGAALAGREPGAFDWNAAGRIPVSSDGRTKPLDTFARNSLMMISGRQTFKIEGVSAPAIQWLFEAMSDPDTAATREVFRIDHPDVMSLAGFSGTDRNRFSFREIQPHLDEIGRQAELASQVQPKKRDPFQRQVLDLDGRVLRYMEVTQAAVPYSVAPLNTGEEWRRLPEAAQTPGAGGAGHPSVLAFTAMADAYARHDAAAFNSAVRSYLDLTESKLAADSTRAGYEVIFNHFEPFMKSSALYVAAFILACFGFLLGTMSKPAWGRSLARTAILLLAIAFIVQTIGIASRIYLQGRPPVTNLYSSAVFIGWACIPLALAAEWFYKLGLGTLVASLIGFATLVVAHNLTAGGDTMEMMQAVLDSNFWLSTHVVVVTIGYSATFLAGFLAATYLLLGAFTPFLRGDAMKTLPRMVYAVICFASLTSFVGTVLGGIWADQSWGRFWGWDPKENGAALIVFMNLLTLHARWGGMIRERGVAVLAVLGNIVTAWSWFGTNMLGVGLHSYGFMQSAVFWLVAFCVLQLVIMCVGFIPVTWWRSVTVPKREPKQSHGKPVMAG